MKTIEPPTLDTIRMKDIIVQLTDVIYLLCNAKGQDSDIILNQFTNLTFNELQSLHIDFSSSTSNAKFLIR